MPELPEVETIARTLEPAIRGRVIVGIELLFRPLLRGGGPKLLAGMQGRRVLGVKRRGKMLLVKCEGARTLVFHLKMTGQFLFAGATEPRDKHTRLVMRFEDGAITIEDDGPGVPVEQRALIFEKFRQGGDALNRPQGTGLGLPISRHIVEHFGGRIWLEPDTAQGACFKVWLPWQASSRDADRSTGDQT